jgi:hypothetical protein
MNTGDDRIGTGHGTNIGEVAIDLRSSAAKLSRASISDDSMHERARIGA